VIVVLVMPASAPTASMATPTLVIPLPNAGDVSIAEAVFRLKGAKVIKALRPKLTVVNAKQLGKDVVVVAAVRQEAKNKNRFDVTAAVIRRGVRTTSAVRGGPSVSVGVFLGKQAGLTNDVIAQNVVQGNYLAKLPFDCGFGSPSFLFGSRTGLPAAGDTVAYACGFWLDQVWPSESFATSFGANWCAVPTDLAAAAAATYNFQFKCNFSTRGVALEDPLKAATILNVVPDSGSCPRVNNYTFLCPQEQGASGTLKATFAAPLPVGFEFGFGTSTDGQKINEFFPARVIEVVSAEELLANAVADYPYDKQWRQARDALVRSDIARACMILHAIVEINGGLGPQGDTRRNAAEAVLSQLDCNTR
jgi:hypothetical protein